jgi:hypothetical protein
MANKNFYVHNGLTVGGLTIDAATGNLTTPGGIITTATTAATTVTSGALQVRGGAGISGDLYVGGTIFDSGFVVANAGNIGTYAVTGVTAGTDTVVSGTTGAISIWNNSTLQTVTSRGATTNQAISITNATESTTTGTGALIVKGGVGANTAVFGSLNVLNAATFAGPVTFSGTATYVYSTNTFYTDNIINLHTPPAGPDGQWTVNDGKDIGLRFHYYITTDTNAALVLNNGTGYLDWYSSGAEGTSTFTGSNFGVFRTGATILTSSTNATSTLTGALQVAGGVGIRRDLWVGGNIYANTIIGSIAGIATSTNNIIGGNTGQIVYQSAPNTTAFAGPGTTGTILVSAGTTSTGPVFTSTGSIYVGFADNVRTIQSTTNNFFPVSFANTWTGGVLPVLTSDLIKVNPSSGVIVATQFNGSGAGLTANSVPNSALQGNGTITVSAGSNGIGVSGSPVALGGTVTVTNLGVHSFLGGTTGLTSTNTTGTVTLTGTLGVANGGTNQTGIGGAGSVVYSDGTRYMFSTGTTGQILVAAGAGAPVFTSTGSIYVGAALLADDVKGGTPGQLVYQIGANDTGFLSTGTAGQLLVSQPGAPAFTSTGSIYVGAALFANTATSAGQATNATNANNLIGGATGSIPYQLSSGATAFIPIGVTNTVLQSNGTTATWVALGGLSSGNATTATNLAGGNLGAIPFQTAAGLTSFIGTGTTGSLLQMGANTATFVTTGSIHVGNAAVAQLANTVNTVLRTTNAAHFIAFVDSNNATSAGELVYTTSTLAVNPSNGRVGIGNSAPNSILDVTGDVRISGITTVSNDLYVTGDLVLTTSTSAIIQSENGVTVQNSAVTVDTWSSSTFRSAKYVVSVSRADAWQTTEILVIHGAGTAFMHDTSVFTTALPIMDFDTIISGSNVILQATGTTAVNHNVRVHRVYLTA